MLATLFFCDVVSGPRRMSTSMSLMRSTRASLSNSGASASVKIRAAYPG
jgi:hypothetical protein